MVSYLSTFINNIILETNLNSTSYIFRNTDKKLGLLNSNDIFKISQNTNAVIRVDHLQITKENNFNLLDLFSLPFRLSNIL